MYLRSLAVHKDHLPHNWWRHNQLLLCHHLVTIGNIIKCLHDDISGPCVSLPILAPEWVRTVPLIEQNVYYSDLVSLRKYATSKEMYFVCFILFFSGPILICMIYLIPLRWPPQDNLEIYVSLVLPSQHEQHLYWITMFVTRLPSWSSNSVPNPRMWLLVEWSSWEYFVCTSIQDEIHVCWVVEALTFSENLWKYKWALVYLI